MYLECRGNDGREGERNEGSIGGGGGGGGKKRQKIENEYIKFRRSFILFLSIYLFIFFFSEHHLAFRRK